MQHEIKKRQSLLRANGTLTEAGYSTKLILDYDRGAITASKYKIKEWDYYLIANQEYALALTIMDNSYMGMESISLIDLKKPWYHTKSPVRLFPMGNTHMPETTEYGDTESYCKDHFLSFQKEPHRRMLKFRMGNFYDNKPIDGEIALQDPEADSMVIATPFQEDPLAFYYNQKINCMPAQGYIRFGDDVIVFQPDTTFGVFDWGRGVWPKNSTWYWGSASGTLSNHFFGFNIGYGFGDSTYATENMLFFDHKAHKISRVNFNIPSDGEKESFMEPWYFTSDDDRFKMVFHPIVDRTDHKSFGWIRTDQHQIFGRFTGRSVLDDGTIVNIKDFLGFAEKVSNKW